MISNLAAEKWEEQRAEDLRRIQSSELELDRAGSVEAFDLAAASVEEMLRTEPPERKWLVRERLPFGVVGLLAAAGSTGKSMALLQLAVSCCTGEPWLGQPLGRSGSVLLISAEEDREEIHRRLWMVTQHYQSTKLIAERLFILERVGFDNRLTHIEDREVVMTDLVKRIIRTVEQMPDPVLIVLDPISRFDGGDGNDNGDATRLIEAAERIRKATGCTVIMAHHMSKAGIRDPESGQEAVRGASGLVDGARWVGVLRTMGQGEAKRYGAAPDDAKHHVRFTTPKSNYSEPWPGMWLERTAGGVLVPADLQESKRARREKRKQHRYDVVLPKLLALVQRKQEQGEPLTRSKLRSYAGTQNVLGVGDQTLRTILQRAIDEGRIIERKRGGKTGNELRTS